MEDGKHCESAVGLSFKIGEALLRNGAEIFRVQETMERVALSLIHISTRADGKYTSP